MTDATRTAGARLGVDVGGTFTDVVHACADGTVTVAKVPSTPRDQAEGILAGATAAEVTLADLARFAHGTTVATNTVLERDGARVVLVTTAGFRDLLEIGRQDRPDLYRQDVQRPDPLVPRELVVEVVERVGADATVVTPLTSEAIAGCVADVVALAPEAVAVSLLFSFAHPAHEEALADALRAALDVPVSTSSNVLPTFREYERTSTTALDAYVAPRLHRYLGSLADRLREGGLTVPLEVMRSAGGTFTAEGARARPVETLLSGPAAGVWGAAAVGAAVGVHDLVTFDMGGTSTDVALVRDGVPTVTSEANVGGLPFGVSSTDVHTVGSGGGSIAWLDAGGALRVGPRSAGAVPGPAAYGRGGTEPTVTDADVVLGRLDPGALLGGTLALDAEAAHTAVGRLAARLGMSTIATAAGIVAIVEAQMTAALRVVSVERGHDPRTCTLVPFGGAGALHQAGLARQLGMRDVLVPAQAGVLAAVGLLVAPIAADAVRTRLTPLVDVTRAWIDDAAASLRGPVVASLEAQGVATPALTAAVDLRYRGQAFELAVPVDAEVTVAELRSAFDAVHEQRYGYAQPDEPVELVNVRVRGEGPSGTLPPRRLAPDAGGADAAVLRQARVPVDGDEGERDVPVLARDRLGVGATIDGPAVLVGLDTTVWVADGQRAEVDECANLRITERA